MKYVKLAMILAGLAGTALSLYYKLPSLGVHGIIVLAACAIPVALGAYGTFAAPGMPRWASIVSAGCFLVAGMKTTEGDALQNIMMAAFFGALLAIALAIKPDRPRAPATA